MLAGFAARGGPSLCAWYGLGEHLGIRARHAGHHAMERRREGTNNERGNLWKRNSRTKLPSLPEAARASAWALPSTLLPKGRGYSSPGAVNRNWTGPLLRSVATLRPFAGTLPTWPILIGSTKP